MLFYSQDPMTDDAICWEGPRTSGAPSCSLLDFRTPPESVEMQPRRLPAEVGTALSFPRPACEIVAHGGLP